MTLFRITPRAAACLFTASTLMGLHSAAHAGDDLSAQAAPPTTQPAIRAVQGLSTSAIIATLERAGYSSITEVEFDDHRYEVEARNAQGQRVELDVHPRSGKILHIDLED